MFVWILPQFLPGSKDILQELISKAYSPKKFGSCWMFTVSATNLSDWFYIHNCSRKSFKFIGLEFRCLLLPHCYEWIISDSAFLMLRWAWVCYWVNQNGSTTAMENKVLYKHNRLPLIGSKMPIIFDMKLCWNCWRDIHIELLV